LEIACFTTPCALMAEQAGADRIEFCKDYTLGGITPNFEDVRFLKEKLQIPVFVMIRPRGGNFVYSEAELNQMKSNITRLKLLDVDGFVFGILDKKNQINRIQNKELVKLAYPIPCTFHRAFDSCKNPLAALENVIECGFQFILTSGNIGKATKGTGVLNQLAKKLQILISIFLEGGAGSSNLDFLTQKSIVSCSPPPGIPDISFKLTPQELKPKKIIYEK